MHKFISLFTIGFFLLMLQACGGKSGNISDMDGANAADSMMYYFGAMQASNYWQDAETDTLLRTEKAREKFLEGFRKAMKMDEDDSAYNKGLQLGLRLAIRLREFEKRYGVTFSENVLANSLEYFLRNDSSINISEAQKVYYVIKDRFELNAATKEIEAAKSNLAMFGNSRGFEMLSDTLYYKDITPAIGDPAFHEGDKIALEVTASTVDGKEITARQFPDSLTLGEGRIPAVVRYSIYTMTNGQTRQFMTTPRSLFGKRYAVYNLPYDEPVIFTVKASK